MPSRSPRNFAIACRAFDSTDLQIPPAIKAALGEHDGANAPPIFTAFACSERLSPIPTGARSIETDASLHSMRGSAFTGAQIPDRHRPNSSGPSLSNLSVSRTAPGTASNATPVELMSFT